MSNLNGAAENENARIGEDKSRDGEIDEKCA
jgi:hypothetical protein